MYKFSNKLWELESENIEENISEVLRNNSEINERMIKGFENLKRTLEIYLNPLIKNYILIIYGSVILENGAIMHTMNKFHGKPWFSNVTIAMNSEELDEYITDEELCYGQVILIMKINEELRSDSKNIALIE